MQALEAGQTFPKIEVAKLGGDTLMLGEPSALYDWQLVVIYRGRHCPLCKKYLAKLEEVKTRFHDNGIDVVVASGDPEERAQAFADELNLSVPVGYGLSVEQMRHLGLYVSDPAKPTGNRSTLPRAGRICDQRRWQVAYR